MGPIVAGLLSRACCRGPVVARPAGAGLPSQSRPGSPPSSGATTRPSFRLEVHRQTPLTRRHRRDRRHYALHLTPAGNQRLRDIGKVAQEHGKTSSLHSMSRTAPPWRTSSAGSPPITASPLAYIPAIAPLGEAKALTPPAEVFTRRLASRYVVGGGGSQVSTTARRASGDSTPQEISRSVRAFGLSS